MIDNPHSGQMAHAWAGRGDARHGARRATVAAFDWPSRGNYWHLCDSREFHNVMDQGQDVC